MDGKRIFLTGGTGFFGKSILRWLMDRKSMPRVTILSRNPSSFLAANPVFSGLPNVSFVAGDVRTFAFPEAGYDWIIHGATEASLTVPDLEMQEVCIEGTRRVLDFGVRCGCSRFMLISSGAVYGVQPAGVELIPEEHPCRPVTAYGKGKLAAEELALTMSGRSGFEVVVPRCFAFVGPYLNLDIHFAIGNFMRDCLAGNPILIRGDGTTLRSYLYADDLVEWLFAVMLRGKNGGVYNVGSDVAVSIRDLAETVRKVAGSGTPIEVLGRKNPDVPAERYIPRIDRIRRELGVEIKVPLEEAIRRSIEFHRSLSR